MLDLLTGDEPILNKPKTESYLITVPRSSARVTARQAATPGAEDGNTETDTLQSVNAANKAAANNALRWQMDCKAWKTNKDNLRIASKLLDEWVCEGIKIEIEDCENAKIAYDLIKERYKVSPERARDILLGQLNDVNLEDFSSVTGYLNKLRQLKVDLKASKYVMTDDMFASVVLHGLPPNYRYFKEQYDRVRSANPDDPPDIDYLFDRLQIEKIKQKRINVFSSRTISAFVAGQFKSSDTWLADTGANMHIVNDIKWFTKFHPLDIQINTADGSSTLAIKGGGTVQVVLKSQDGYSVTVSLSDVAYAPQGRCNLFSCGVFVEKGKMTGVYNDESMTWVTKDGQEVGCAKFVDGLYHLDVKEPQKLPAADNPFESGEVIAAVVDFDDPVWKWHRRLGHLSFQSMLNLQKSSGGMDITEKQIKAKLKAVCPVCAVTRALVKVPRDPAKRHAQQPGQLMHADTWGPYPIEGFDGSRYFLFITDDFSRYTWCERFSSKGELPELFRSLHKRIERTYGFTIRSYRFDGEFANGPIGKWCEKHSIGTEPTQPYAHYRNGVAERNNRTIREKTAPLVQETNISGHLSKIISEKGTELLRVSSIPENLWPEAVEHGVWLKNRSPARALRKKEKKTPWEALKDDRPTLDRERIWGSRAYVTLPLESRAEAQNTKLHSPRGWLGYFVGCESEAMYRIYSPDKHKVYRIGVAQVDDGEGLDDPQNGPSLQDRVPTPEIDSPDEESYVQTDEDGTDNDHDEESGREASRSVVHDEDNLDARTEQSGLDLENDSSQTYHDSDRLGELVHSRTTNEDADDEDSDQESDNTPVTKSEYFGGMAAKTNAARKKRRRATHDYSSSDKESLSSALSEMEAMSSSDSEGPTEVHKTKRKREKPVKRYLPDDSRCDCCFRNGKRCDRELVGVPCSTCKREHRTCIDQTPETKALIHPEDRDKVAKTLKDSQNDPPCRSCFQEGRNCYGGDGQADCKRCIGRHKTCTWDLT